MTSKEWYIQNGKDFDNRPEAIRACSDALDISLRSARKAIKRLEDTENFVLGDIKESQIETTVDAEGLPNLSIITKIPVTVDELIELAGLDSKIWEVDKGRVGFWGNEKTGNYQHRCTYKRKISEGGQEFLEELKSLVLKFAPAYPELKYQKQEGKKYLLEIDIFDAHLGMISEKYNVDIATSRYYNSVIRILNWYKDKNIERIVFPIGNDLLNADVLGRFTTKKTYMEDEAQDSRNTYKKAFETLVKSIELCRTVAPVDVIGIEGNHDKNSTFLLLHSLEAYFSKCDEVKIVNDGKTIHFYTYGNNLIGYHHGDSIKMKDLPMVMAVNAVNFSSYKNRVWKTGHTHHKNTKDVIVKNVLTENDAQGIRISTCAALTDSSFWAMSHGYESIKECTGTLWDKEQGDISNYSFKYQKGEI